MALPTLGHLFLASIPLVYSFILASLPSSPLWKVQLKRKLKAEELISQVYQIHQLRVPQVTLN